MKRVILVRTLGPRNAGLAARAAANFPPCELWFVAPERSDLLRHPEFNEMSHGVEHPERSIQVVPTLGEALEDCSHSIGFTARFRQHRVMVNWKETAPAIRDHASDPDRVVALVFGNERMGLSTEESDQVAELAWIPTGSEHTSINLAMTVGIVLSDLMGDGRDLYRTRKGRPLVGDSREFLRLHLRDVLSRHVGSDAARRDLRASIDRIFGRAPLETRDARAWHRLLRHLGSDRQPSDYGLRFQDRTRRS
ncbi:MAG: TrmH family RNA methyltransferase [Planctomycetota bacterium]